MHGDALPPLPPIDRLQRSAGRHVGLCGRHGPNRVFGLADVVQAFVARRGARLGYDAGEIGVSAMVRVIRCVALVTVAAPAAADQTPAQAPAPIAPG